MKSDKPKWNRTRAGAAALALTVAAVCIAFAAPMATDSEIEAAERAPLNPYAVNGEWNTLYEPFKVIGNIYYVGTKGVSSFLITTPKGHFLIDGIVPQSAPLIIANIKTLGFDVRDVKILLNTHAHFDHAGGLAGLQRASQAKMVASQEDKPTLERGDIGFGPSAGMKFPPIRVDQIIKDGEELSLGGTTLKAHATPGHTQGCTSWSLDVTGGDGKRHRAFVHCSSTVAGQTLVPESWPGMVAAYRTTFEKLRHVQADVFLGNHENFFGLFEKRERQLKGDANAFVDPEGLKNFNLTMEAAFNKELTSQQQKASQPASK